MEKYLGMAISLKYVTLFLLILSATSCKKEVRKVNKSDIKTTDTTYVDGILLELIDSTGSGNLKIHSEKYNVKGEIVLQAPYKFLRYNNKVVSHSYLDVDINHIILFSGKNGVQPIIFKEDSITYYDHYITTENFENAPDEIMYYQFAH